MKSMTKMIASLIVISVLTAGCSLLAGGNANSQTAQETAVANTVVALQNVLSINSNPTLPAESITPTPQILPTYTAIASIQPTTAPEYVPVATTEPQFRITDIQDITVPDNSVYKPGDTFTKIWQLTNGGSATWSSDFKLVFVNGDLMGATTVTLGHTVAPNQTVDVSVNLVAPATDGTYQGSECFTLHLHRCLPCEHQPFRQHHGNWSWNRDLLLCHLCRQFQHLQHNLW